MAKCIVKVGDINRFCKDVYGITLEKEESLQYSRHPSDNKLQEILSYHNVIEWYDLGIIRARYEGWEFDIGRYDYF